MHLSFPPLNSAWMTPLQYGGAELDICSLGPRVFLLLITFIAECTQQQQVNRDISRSLVNLLDKLCIWHLPWKPCSFFRSQNHLQSFTLLNLKKLHFRIRLHAGFLSHGELCIVENKFSNWCHDDVKKSLLHVPIIWHCRQGEEVKGAKGYPMKATSCHSGSNVQSSGLNLHFFY